MATLTRSHAVSTPKGHLPSTPNRMMASPRPSTSTTAQKPFAYKSPAVKTPASGHGHAHSVSVTSQPSSTPLAAAAIHDELLALNSPAAALINSIAPTGLTPMTSGEDGLGISTRGQGVLPRFRDGQPPRNPEAARLAQLQQAITNLKTKAIGRGITRESVERVARLEGFEALWDEDILTIAGNIVEVELVFDSVYKDNISDLVLKLNSAEGEPQVQQEATLILRKQIGAASGAATENLEAFAKNLRYLSQMDRIDVIPNSFEVTGNLFKTFRTIWEEERKRMTWRTSLHTRKGTFGNVYLDRDPKVGISLKYWQDGPTAYHSGDVTAEVDSHSHQAMVSCESGAPGVSASQSWLSPNILMTDAKTKNVLDEVEPNLVPDWENLLPQAAADVEAKVVEDEKDEAVPMRTTLNVHFHCELEPEVLLPVSVAMKVNSEICPINIDQSKALTYQTALQKLRNALPGRDSSDAIESRWSRRLPCVERDGEVKFAAHSYALYPVSSSTELWVFPISNLTFNHPKQLAAAIPVIRQYALLLSMLKSLVMQPVSQLSSQPRLTSDRKRIVSKRSNKNKSTLINNTSVPETPKQPSLPVDITLDLLSDPSKCKIEVFAPLTGQKAGADRSSFLHLALLVGPNGTVEVSEISGTSAADLIILKLKLVRMLESTEDIGIVLQWLINARGSGAS